MRLVEPDVVAPTTFPSSCSVHGATTVEANLHDMNESTYISIIPYILLQSIRVVPTRGCRRRRVHEIMQCRHDSNAQGTSRCHAFSSVLQRHARVVMWPPHGVVRKLPLGV